MLQSSCFSGLLLIASIPYKETYKNHSKETFFFWKSNERQNLAHHEDKVIRSWGCLCYFILCVSKSRQKHTMWPLTMTMTKMLYTLFDLFSWNLFIFWPRPGSYLNGGMVLVAASAATTAAARACNLSILSHDLSA